MSRAPHRLLPCLVVLLAGAPALAADGLPAQQFHPASGGHEGFVHVDGAWTLPHAIPAAGLYVDYAKDPLVLARGVTGERVELIEHMLQAHFMGAVGLWDRLQLGVVVPVNLFQREGSASQTLRPGELSSTVMGDLRLVPKLRIHEDYQKGAGLSFLAEITLPTGDEENLQGNAGVTVEPRVAFEYRPSDYFRIGATLGYLMRPTQRLFNIVVGNEITYGLAAEVSFVPKKWAVIAEAHGKASADSTLDGDEISAEEFPFELALAGRHWIREDHALTLGLGGGVGKTAAEGYGTPRVRVFAGYLWQPHKERKRDGGTFVVDHCPDDPNKLEPGPCGCGTPDTDSDGDGVLDCKDGCPADRAKTAPGECGCGVADTDRDGDGTLDCKERCPDDPAKTEPGACGCGTPDVDSDGDGTPDCTDKCPKDPKDVCDVDVHPCAIVIGDKIHFGYDKDTIKAKSFPILDAVADVLLARPEIQEVEVQGHTDWDGSDAYNMDLSQRRAASVVRYLVGKRVAAKRLRAKGYGESRPIDSNETREGRANNRRVEFIFTKCLGPKSAGAGREGRP